MFSAIASKAIIFGLWVLMPFTMALDIASAQSLKSPALGKSAVLGVIDFTDLGKGSVKDWLEAKGFALKADTENERKIGLNFSSDGLVIEAKKGARALLVSQRRA
jgi:hypothetical protein